MKTTRKKYRWNVKKFLSNLYVTISVFFILWMLVSYFDIISHNLSGGTTWEKNLLMLMFNK